MGLESGDTSLAAPQHLSRWLTLAGLGVGVANVVIPLAIDRTQTEFFHAVKVYWLLILGGLVLFSTGAALATSPDLRKYVRRSAPVRWALLTLAAVSLSTLFSVGPRTSFFSDPYVNQGWLAWAGYSCLFFGVVISPSSTRKIIYLAVEMAAVLTAWWVIGERVGLVRVTELAWSRVRPPGPIGSAQYTAEWLCLAFFIVNTSPLPRRSRTRRLTAGLIGAAILLTRTRGGIIGLGVGGLFMLLVKLNTGGHRRAGFALLAALSAAGAGWFALSVSLTNVSDIPMAGRLLNLFSPHTASAQGRLTYWEDSLHMILDQPDHGVKRVLFGYGLETLNLIYAPYMTDQLVRSSPGNPPYALPFYGHNQWLDLWRDTGLTGLIGFNGWLGLALWGGLRSGGWRTSRRWLLFTAGAALAGAILTGGVYGAGSLVTGTILGAAAVLLLFGLIAPVSRVNPETLGLLAGLVGFVVALQFGFLTSATGVLLWTTAGLLIPPPPGLAASEAPSGDLLIRCFKGLVILLFVSGFMTSGVDLPFINRVILSRASLSALAFLGVGVAAWQRPRLVVLAILALAILFNAFLLRLYTQPHHFSLARLQGAISLHLLVWTLVPLGLVALTLHRAGLTLRPAALLGLAVLGLPLGYLMETRQLFQCALDARSPAVQRAIFETALDRTPPRALWYDLAALRAEENGDTTHAIELVSRARQIEPTTPLYLAEQARIKISYLKTLNDPLARADWISRVERDFETLAALMPHHPAPWTGWAQFELLVPDPQRAYDLAVYATVIGANDYIPTWVTLGDAAVVLAQIEPARALEFLTTARMAYLRAWFLGPDIQKRLDFVDAMEARLAAENPP